jgi:hypothetical protein
MPDKRQKIIERIDKLLRVAARSNIPGEVEAAQARAQELITKYQIEEAQINGHIVSGNVVSKKVLLNAPYVASKAMLLHYIAKHNFCKVLRSDDYAVIYGFLSDIEFCLTLYEALCLDMIGSMPNKLDHARYYADEDFDVRSWTKSFFAGYSVRIGDRLLAAKENIIKEVESTGQSVAIAIRDKQHAVEDFFQSIDKSPAYSHKLSSKAGYLAGMDSANSANLLQTPIKKGNNE